MELLRLLFLLSISATYVYCALIPSKSIIMSTHSMNLYVFPELENWVQNGISRNSTFITINSTFLKNTKGISFIHRENRQIVVFSDADYNHISAINASGSDRNATVFHIGTSSGVGQVAVDWVSGNCYWVDTVYGWIVMQAIPKDLRDFSSANPNFKTVVDTYLDMPTGIAVYPELGYLFWTDTGKIPKIERSSLNGANRKLLTWQGVIRPTSLCIDYQTNLLYWTDYARGTVEYTDIHGSGRKILISNVVSRFYGIDIFQDKLFVSYLLNDTLKGFVTFLDKADGRPTDQAIIFETPVFSMTVFDERRQPVDPSQRCDTLTCQQICIEIPNSTGADCACEDGFTLELDGETCTVETQVLQNKIVYTDTNKICFVSINAITSYQKLSPEVGCTVVNSTNNITRFTIDTHNKTFYFTDGHRIYYQRAFSINGSRDVYRTDREIIDLAYDWIKGDLYWFEWDAQGGVCYKKSGPDFEKQEITRTSTKPITITFNPYTQKLFWMAKNTNDSIVKLYTTSSDGKTVSISSPIIKSPTDLEYDTWTDRLFWTDNGFIGQIKPDGTKERKIDLDKARKYQCITVFKNYTIIGYSLTNGQQTASAFAVVQEEGESWRQIEFPLPNMAWTNDVKVYAEQLNKIEPCEMNNGGCEQICLPGENTACSCYVGYTLNEDRKTCQTVVMDKYFILVLDSIHHKAYQINMSDGNINTLTLVTGSMPSSIDYDPINKRIVWIDTDEKKIQHFKLKDKAARAERKDDITKYSHVAVDVITGNFYVTMNNKIAVINPDFEVVTSITTASTPEKLKLFPKLRQMVWIEGSIIRKAKMDGKESNIFVEPQGMSTPSDIAFDYEDEALYWSERSLGKIGRITLMQAQRTTIFERTGEYPNNIYVAGQYLYYTSDINTRAVYRRSKMPGGTGYTLFFESPLVGGLTSLFVYMDPNPCESNNGGCEQICLPVESKSCSCYVGYKLNEDGMTCSKVLNLYLIIGSAAGGGLLLSIIIIIIVAVHYRRKRPLPLPSLRVDTDGMDNGSCYDELSETPREYETLPQRNLNESRFGHEISTEARDQQPPYLDMAGVQRENPYKSKIVRDERPSRTVSGDYLTTLATGPNREGLHDRRVSHLEEDDNGYLRSSNDLHQRYESSGRFDESVRYQPWDMMQQQARGNSYLPATNSQQNPHNERTSRFQTQYRY
ncbi:hypothetical protein ACJMK2_019404 [Sinanodonta woodiana]|uniref:EGF-like domain-containing protein n=1 Tax=Sinanodonta woodiana TaxID=1069815 RepID=A0ABD3UKB6_SINWO